MARKPSVTTGSEPIFPEGGTTGTDNVIGTGSDSVGSIDPASAAPAFGERDPQYYYNADGSIKRNSDGSPRKRRAKRGSRTSGGSSSKTSAGQLSVGSIESALIGIHASLALLCKAEELVLEPDESKPYAQALADVASLYDIPEVTKEAIAWTSLFFIMAKIYGPRILMINERKRAEKATKVPPESNVVSFGQGNFTPDVSST